MDLTQNKLTRSEWENIEVPISDTEKQIVQMIIDGYHNINIRFNESQSLFSHIKIPKTTEVEYFLYKKYFDDPLSKIFLKYKKEAIPPELTSNHGGELKQLRSADMYRLQNLDNTIQQNREKVYEFIVIDLCKDMLRYLSKKSDRYAFYLYTLLQLQRSSIRHVNQFVTRVVEYAMAFANAQTTLQDVIAKAYDFIERNPFLLQYEDKQLFVHQKELFLLCQPEQECPRLILYTAPTGTGKTLSPIGLSERRRVIFVCVARHIGLALARAAISMEKKVAFAFGCSSAADIRLHYFAAVDYTKNKRTGGIGKVDNSVGDNVEIMICDVQSYLTAMYYMMAFNPVENLVMYWDETTITLDREDHPLHATIRRNWTENKIPTVIMSCATLPSDDELQPVFDGFREKFEGAQVHTITSYDCKKSIPILNKDGYCVLPHYLYESYDEMRQGAEFCANNKTLLRYFDLREIVRFIEYVELHEEVLTSPRYRLDAYFTRITDITMNSLKEYYIELLLHCKAEAWPTLYAHLMRTRVPKQMRNGAITKSRSVDGTASSVSSGAPLARTTSVGPTTKLLAPPTTSGGILFTTADAHTLTDGPTIFLADNVHKIGTFYIQQTNIPQSVFQSILSKIDNNARISAQIDELEEKILVKDSKVAVDSEGKTKTINKERMCTESKAWMEQVNRLRKEIRAVSLDSMYVPNTRAHQQLWTSELHENAFVSSIGEETAKHIMGLDIDNNLKVLLLLGIGIFMETPVPKYMEVMKQLADEQRLFIIIASSDYIYGTNYQFCHGVISKDLTQMTPQKTLQAMGRIGRNNIQQDYTVRFRDDAMIRRLFSRPEVNLEAVMMRALFTP